MSQGVPCGLPLFVRKPNLPECRLRDAAVRMADFPESESGSVHPGPGAGLFGEVNNHRQSMDPVARARCRPAWPTPERNALIRKMWRYELGGVKSAGPMPFATPPRIRVPRRRGRRDHPETRRVFRTPVPSSWKCGTQLLILLESTALHIRRMRLHPLVRCRPRPRGRSVLASRQEPFPRCAGMIECGPTTPLNGREIETFSWRGTRSVSQRHSERRHPHAT